jgi:ribosomal subunit interface protein
MMNRLVVLVPLTFIMQARSTELAGNHVVDAQDKLADDLMNKLVIELSNRMYGSLSDDAGFENSVLGKPGMPTVPTSRQSPLYAQNKQRFTQVQRVSTAPVKAPLPPARRFDPFKGPNKDLVTGVPEDYQAVAQSLTNKDTWDAIQRASEALANSPDIEELPYSINFFVHGGYFGDMGSLGNDNKNYMESRIVSALKYYQDKIQAVDVRMNIEGKDPKTYRMEVTVKLNSSPKRTSQIVLSNPMNSEYSFIEAVDHMHDTLKQALRKEKEKSIAKKRHSRRDAKGMNDMPEDDGEGPKGKGGEYQQIFDGAGDSPY